MRRKTLSKNWIPPMEDTPMYRKTPNKVAKGTWKKHQKTRFIALKGIAWEFAKLKEHQQFNLKVGFFTITLHQNLIGVEVIDGRVLVNRQMEKGRPRWSDWVQLETKVFLLRRKSCKRVFYLHQSVNFFHGRKFYFFWIFLRHLRRSIFCFPPSFEILTISWYWSDLSQ